MGLERMTCCGALTRTYSDAGERSHAPDCPQRFLNKEGRMLCEHGFTLPCTECDPYTSSRAIAEGRPVSSPD